MFGLRPKPGDDARAGMEGISAMANITAQMVKELREKTGAGMMDCKAALGETAGDMEEAVDWLRKKGLAKAAKKAGRIAAEGLVAIALKGTKGVVVEVNSETDFVARNDMFQGLVKMIADIALEVWVDVEKIKAARAGSIAVAEAIADTIAKFGENMTLRRAAALSVGKGVVAGYVHNAVTDGLGKMGVITALESVGKADELARFGRMVAMHVAAANPQAIDRSDLDPDLIRRERDVLSDKAKAQGKPANVIDKIVESGLNSFYNEVCLLDQAFIHDPAKTVAQAIEEAERKAGAPIKITGFIRYAVGEGVEKQDSQ
jgi:elongation factor Ts